MRLTCPHKFTCPSDPADYVRARLACLHLPLHPSRILRIVRLFCPLRHLIRLLAAIPYALPYYIHRFMSQGTQGQPDRSFLIAPLLLPFLRLFFSRILNLTLLLARYFQAYQLKPPAPETPNQLPISPTSQAFVPREPRSSLHPLLFSISRATCALSHVLSYSWSHDHFSGIQYAKRPHASHEVLLALES